MTRAATVLSHGTDDITFRGPLELNRDGSLVALRSLFEHQNFIYERKGEDLRLCPTWAATTSPATSC